MSHIYLSDVGNSCTEQPRIKLIMVDIRARNMAAIITTYTDWVQG
jgi:hypothetical protein